MGFDGGLEENVVEVYYCIFMHKNSRIYTKQQVQMSTLKTRGSEEEDIRVRNKKKHWSTKWLTNVDIDVLKKETNLSG